MEMAHLKAAALGFLRIHSHDPPTIDGYTFQGLGWCQNAQGSYYSFETIPDIASAEKCADACTEGYSSDAGYAGINFHPDWFGSPNCNCMKTDDWTSGKIAGANGWNEELCYSWDEAQGLPPTPQEPEEPAPTIDGYKFRGMGCCENSEGYFYGYDTIPGIESVERCAAACMEAYSSNELFVGINYHPNWFGSPNCNCMKDSDRAMNGKITGAGGWCEELCYSYNQADPPSTPNDYHCFTDTDPGGKPTPVCPGKDNFHFCDGEGDCDSTDYCDCQVGQAFCNEGINPCADINLEMN